MNYRTRCRYRLAYHEAGHAVVALVLGLGLESVNIIPDKTERTERYYTGGKTHVRGFFTRPASADDVDPDLDFYLTLTAVVILAGEASQRRYAPRSFRKTHVMEDYLKLKNIVSDSRIPELKVFAERLVNKHWPAISAVALRLQSVRELSGVEVQRLATAHHSPSPTNIASIASQLEF